MYPGLKPRRPVLSERGSFYSAYGLTWWRKPENPRKTTVLTGDHYPATRLHPRSNPGGSGDKRVFNHYAMTITVSYFKETIQNGPTFNVLCAVWPSTDWKDFSDIFKTK